MGAVSHGQQHQTPQYRQTSGLLHLQHRLGQLSHTAFKLYLPPLPGNDQHVLVSTACASLTRVQQQHVPELSVGRQDQVRCGSPGTPCRSCPPPESWHPSSATLPVTLAAYPPSPLLRLPLQGPGRWSGAAKQTAGCCSASHHPPPPPTPSAARGPTALAPGAGPRPPLG